MPNPHQYLTASLALAYPLSAAPFALPRPYTLPLSRETTARRASVDPGGASALLFSELQQLSEATQRGFKATSVDRARANALISQLQALNPTSEPAAAFYSSQDAQSNPAPGAASLLGRWRLVYTDAPDIIGLEAQQGPLAELGRIGQECDGIDRTIVNVISWRPARWLREGQPTLLGRDSVDQRIVLKASAVPSAPRRVNLFVEGFDLAPRRLLGRPAADGLPGLRLRGPLSGQIPFGAFEVLYLDASWRVTKTTQGRVAVNIRDDAIRDAEA